MIKRLKELRMEASISQQLLAEQIGVSQQSINKYENHNVEPDYETLIALARFFRTSVDYLIGNSDVNHIVEDVTPFHLNEKESSLIKDYRLLTKEEQESVATIIQHLNHYKPHN